MVLSSGGPAVDPARPGPAVTDVQEERPGRVTGTVETDGEPFWLKLDQSINEGWELEIEGATVEGPRPLGAFANGWLVHPDAPGTLEITARWAPQRVADVALVVSLAGVLLCGVLLFVRRPGRGRLVHDAELERRPAGPRWWAVCAAAILAALFIAPVAAVPSAVLVALARREPWIARLTPAVLLGAAAALVVIQQHRHAYPPTFEWMTSFRWVHQTALLGIMVLLATTLPAASRRDRG
jgi:hypothetical protein